MQNLSALEGHSFFATVAAPAKSIGFANRIAVVGALHSSSTHPHLLWAHPRTHPPLNTIMRSSLAAQQGQKAQLGVSNSRRMLGARLQRLARPQVRQGCINQHYCCPPPSLQHLTLRMHGAGRCHGADCAHTRSGHPKVLRGRLSDPQAPHTHGHGEGDGLVERAQGTPCRDQALKQPTTLPICNCRWAR